MSAPQLSDEVIRETLDAVRRSGSICGAMRETGLPRQTIQSRLRRAKDRGIESQAWTAKPLPTKDRSIEELLEAKRKQATQATDFEEGTKLAHIEIHTPGPIGLMVFGDPHIDSYGCDLNLLESHLKLAKARPDTVFAGNIGDIRDNWIGRLSMLVWQNTLSAKESWKLAEWLFTYFKWCWLIRGNHDMWCGDNDPLDWISKSAGIGVDRDSGQRIAFHHPCGAETRLHARHDFTGKSIYNLNHGMKREALFAFRDHIMVAGHLHAGCDSAEIIAEQLIQMVRVSGYKRSDQYRHSRGFHPSPIHPAALIIVDPSRPDDCRSRSFVAPTVEEGMKYLDWRREEFETAEKQAKAKTRRAAARRA
jgi:hypothetical protein